MLFMLALLCVFVCLTLKCSTKVCNIKAAATLKQSRRVASPRIAAPLHSSGWGHYWRSVGSPTGLSRWATYLRARVSRQCLWGVAFSINLTLCDSSYEHVVCSVPECVRVCGRACLYEWCEWLVVVVVVVAAAAAVGSHVPSAFSWGIKSIKGSAIVEPAENGEWNRAETRAPKPKPHQHQGQRMCYNFDDNFSAYQTCSHTHTHIHRDTGTLSQYRMRGEFN